MTAAACAICLAAGAESGAGQGTGVVVLDRPDARLNAEFSLLRGYRELPDGRLLLSDYLEERIAIGDFATGAVVDRGRAGSGPAEYRLPTRLLPFRGDSSLLIDLGNSRLSVLDGEGVIRRSLDPPEPAAAQPGGADDAGRVYFTVPPWMTPRPLPGDSLQLRVWDTSTGAVRDAARVHGSTPSPQKARDLGPRVPYVIFAPQDTWAVAPEGGLAIIRDAGYVVEWLQDGRRTTGPRHAARPVAVTAADRREAIRGFAAASPVGGRPSPGSTPSGLSAAPSEFLADEGLARLERASTFAERLPDFRGALADAAGRVWVERWTAAGAPARYDVFDREGRRLVTVELATGRRLALVGRSHVYVVHTDDLGLQRVERHRLDRLDPGGRG